MISLSRDGVWQITCGGCLATLPDATGTRSEVVALITGPPHFWEMQDLEMCRCCDCSRRARDVTPPRLRGKRSRR